jgi:hypothetical protein
MSGWIEFQLNGLPDDAETTLYVTYPGGQPELKVARGAKLNLIELDPGSYQVDFGESVADGVHYYPLDHTPGQPITVQVTESDNFVVAHYAPLVLTFEGVGKLRLGMTMDEAKAADPSVQVGHSDEYYGGDCGGGFSNDIEAMAFNPDGKLAWIVVKDYVATEKGIRKGSSGKYIAAAYTLKSKNYTKEGYSGVTVNSTGAEDEDGKLPLLVLSLGNSGKNVGEMEGEIASATVDWIALDGGQQCFD